MLDIISSFKSNPSHMRKIGTRSTTESFLVTLTLKKEGGRREGDSKEI